jgi:hypothetical protein
MKRDEMKKENIYRVWFRVSFDPTMWISLKRNKKYCNNIGHKGANWPPKLIGIFFLPWARFRVPKQFGTFSQSFPNFDSWMSKISQNLIDLQKKICIYNKEEKNCQKLLEGNTIFFKYNFLQNAC